jgi:hypothetical protein
MFMLGQDRYQEDRYVAERHATPSNDARVELDLEVGPVDGDS